MSRTKSTKRSAKLPKRFASTSAQRPRTRIARHPFGSLSHKMKDHIYFLESGYIYTTPRITCKLNMKFYAAILLSADRKPFTVRIGTTEITTNALVMRQGTKFVFSADDIKFLCVFVEPIYATFGWFQAVPENGLLLDRRRFAKLDVMIGKAYEGTLSCAQAAALFESAVAIACADVDPKPALDRRIEKVIRIATSHEERSLLDLSDAVELSYYRLSHLFAENLGISLRQFMQWRKVTATASLLATRSITEAAHEAGFTDSAHLSRTFQEIYGIPPSYLNDANCVRRFYCQRS